MRRSLAIALLCVQASVAAHLALASHITADTGAVVDAKPQCPQPHSGQGIAHGHELKGDDAECEAVALLHTAARACSAFVAAGPVELAAPGAGLGSARERPPLEPLSVAPKASPPA
jgi:hypothetical protein